MQGEVVGGPESKSERVPKGGRGLGNKTIALRTEVLDVFTAFKGSMSSRQVYYQLVSRGAVTNCARSYGVVQRLLVQMRRDGSVPYYRVVDRTRSKHHQIGWDGVEDLMEGCAAQYRRDAWRSQSTHVHICCEKQALEGVFSEVVDKFGAPLWTIRGFISESFAYEWAEEIRALNEDDIDVVIAYFGDHDPSGLALEADCRNRLERQGAEFTWARAGLLLEDFEHFDLVNVDVKHTDSRAKKYLERFGNRAAELDALPPDELQHRIQSAIEEHIDVDAWNALRRTEKVERASLKQVVAQWKDIVGLVEPDVRAAEVSP